MQFPIAIGLHRSRVIDRALVLTALVAIALPFAYINNNLYFPPIFFVTFFTIFWAWKALSPSAYKIYLERSGQIRVCLEEKGANIAAHCLPGATVHPWLTVFRLQIEDGQRLTVIATADSLHRDEFRQLRAFLRWQANFNARCEISS